MSSFGLYIICCVVVATEYFGEMATSKIHIKVDSKVHQLPKFSLANSFGIGWHPEVNFLLRNFHQPIATCLGTTTSGHLEQHLKMPPRGDL